MRKADNQFSIMYPIFMKGPNGPFYENSKVK
jgi:hypothetical protein